MLTVEPNSAEDRVTLSLSKGDPRTFDAVVLAVPPRQVERILGDASRYGIANVEAYDAYPIVDVHLWHDGGSIGYDFVAALESPLQWIFEKAPGYLCCSISAAQQYLQMPTEAIESLAWREVQTFLPALKNAKLLRSAVTRNPEATWLPRVGAPRTAQATTHPAIAIAGSWTNTGWSDTMESAVRSGALAASYLLEAQNGLQSLGETEWGRSKQSLQLFRASQEVNFKTSFFRESGEAGASPPPADRNPQNVLSSAKSPHRSSARRQNSACGARRAGFCKSSPPKAGGRESSRRT